MRHVVPSRCLALAFVLGWALSHSVVFGQNETKKPIESAPPASAEKIRKTLDHVLLLDYEGQSIEDAVRHLKEKTQIHFMVDHYALQSAGLPLGEVPMQVSLKANGIKIRQALQRMLSPYGLTYVILDEGILVTTEEIGVQRQMRQRTPVDVKEVPLHKALRDVARKSGINLVIDPRVLKQAQAPVSLEVEEATVETAIRLLAELGDLKAVRMGNVLFVTAESRADKIRKEESPTQALPGMIFPDAGRAGGIGGVVPGIGFGGGMLPPLGGVPGAPAAPPVPDNDGPAPAVPQRPAPPAPAAPAPVAPPEK